MFHKIQSVFPQENFILHVVFENGEEKDYDTKPLFNRWEIFKSLQTVKGLFGQVKVDQGGYGISWNDELDLSCEELYQNGTPSHVPFV